MDNLSKRHCEACRVGSLPVTDSDLKIFSENFKEWELLNENGIRKIKKQFKFPNFQEALSFTIKMGKLSEEQGHHPLLTLEWGKVSVIWWTHKIKDLHKSLNKIKDLYVNIFETKTALKRELVDQLSVKTLSKVDFNIQISTARSSTDLL